MTQGNLVLCRNKGQSVFIGTGEHQVKLTVLSTQNLGMVTFIQKGDVSIECVDSRVTKLNINGEKVVITTVECYGRTIKMAFEANKNVSIDREEIRVKKLTNPI